MDKEIRKRAICDIVKHHSQKGPIWQLTVKKIAKLIGVSHSTIYKQFGGGMDHIAAQIVRKELADIYTCSGAYSKLKSAVDIETAFYEECNANIIATAATVMPDIHRELQRILSMRFKQAA